VFRYLPLLLVFLLSGFYVNAQHDDFFYSGDMDEEGMSSILTYEKYNPIVGGDSLRLCDGRKCNGIITDTYPDGKIKHKGYYNNGQLLNGYENFFDNGQSERKFKTLASNKGSVIVYYSDGGIRSEVVYFKGEVMMWKDYYPNGNMEYWEEYDKSLQYYVTYNFYYINGNPQSTMTLLDKKAVIYDAAEYFNNGNVKAKGQKKWAPGIGGYVKVGNWTIYDIEGKVIRTEFFEAGANAEEDELEDL
jgi:antitoxin component YwqK of YwqJK toxin-antitoxin module